jgi:Flp pilus assembly protein TadG
VRDVWEQSTRPHPDWYGDADCFHHGTYRLFTDCTPESDTDAGSVHRTSGYSSGTDRTVRHTCGISERLCAEERCAGNSGKRGACVWRVGQLYLSLWIFVADGVDLSAVCFARQLHVQNASASTGKRGKLMRVWHAMHRVADERGATLAEFAFTLPLLVGLLYAVFDFGSALTLKQKLGSAVYEAARAGAGQGTSDLSDPNVSTSVNGSVANLKDTVANSLLRAGVSDCGLLVGGTPAPTPASFRWVYTANAGCPGTLQLTIERQNVVSATDGGATTVWVTYTHVQLQYPFQWRLAKVIQLISPSGTFPGTTLIHVDASMPNLS